MTLSPIVAFWKQNCAAIVYKANNMYDNNICSTR